MGLCQECYGVLDHQECVCEWAEKVKELEAELERLRWLAVDTTHVVGERDLLKHRLRKMRWLITHWLGEDQ